MAQGFSAAAIAHPNIAFIKYWGDRDPSQHLPANGSISMNLGSLVTRTEVAYDPAFARDVLVLNGTDMQGSALERVSTFLDTVRRLAGMTYKARVTSENNFPTSAGIASSAAAFAALALAATRAAGLSLPEAALSRLARLGSGSACRSVPGGFVEWEAGTGDEDSFASTIAPPGHWDLVDCIAIVHSQAKATPSVEGHRLAATSPLQAARLAGAPQRLQTCRKAILQRDFAALAEIVEMDSNLMHAVMLTSSPSLLFWQPASIEIMDLVKDWRRQGLPVCYTLDAGPNVHVICQPEAANKVTARLRSLPSVERVLESHPGGPVCQV